MWGKNVNTYCCAGQTNTYCCSGFTRLQYRAANKALERPGTYMYMYLPLFVSYRCTFTLVFCLPCPPPSVAAAAAASPSVPPAEPSCEAPAGSAGTASAVPRLASAPGAADCSSGVSPRSPAFCYSGRRKKVGRVRKEVGGRRMGSACFGKT